ncbi:hypothetical protein IMSAGC006_00595 [Muribaculaceae bacterium]|jgi:hypothetical protein|nr:hypothetical protein IMSAGC006_00595 [Muribaculaceae bacterium]
MYIDDLTPRILDNIPKNFLEIYCINLVGEISIDSLIIKAHEGSRFADEILALYCFARNGSKKAIDYLNSVLHFKVVFP